MTVVNISDNVTIVFTSGMNYFPIRFLFLKRGIMRRLMSSTVLVIILLLGCSREHGSEKNPVPQSPAVSQLKEAAEGETISVSELVKWQFLGEGEIKYR